MRMSLFVLVLALAVPLLGATNPPAVPPPDDRDQAREESRTFARQLHYLVRQVGDAYVKPLPAEDLYVAALTGLYQTARRPLPRDLRTQVRHAIERSAALRSKSSTAIIDRPDDDPCEQLIVRLRDTLASTLGQEAALRAACRGLTTILDEHSGLVTVEEQRRAAGLDRVCLGVGVEFPDRVGTGPLAIDAVHPGSPAQRAGIRPGDVITHIDRVAIVKATPEKLAALRTQRVADYPIHLSVAPNPDSPATPAPPAEMTIAYQRRGESEERSAKLVPEQFRPETVLGVRRKENNVWDYSLDEKQSLAYLRITSLSRFTSDDLRFVLENLRDQKVRGLMLDLRWCPGGYLTEAIRTADLFLGNCTIATEKARDREDLPYRSAEGDKFRDFALVVLVNAESSGGAELIAAALQDHGRALVIGQRTRGKASVQVPLEVGVPGLALKVTKGTFIRPSGKNLHRFRDSAPSDDWGVIPDEDFRVSPQLSKRMKEWHQAYALRPGTSNDRMALDDPNADTQRLAALALLRKEIERKRIVEKAQTTGCR